MMAVLISLGMWGVAVYSLRVACCGNPLYVTVLRAEGAVLREAERVMAGQREPGDAAEAAFLRAFSRYTLLELAVFGGEVGLLAYLLWGRRLVWLAALLLVKDLLLVAVAAGLARRRVGTGVFRSLRELPAWYLWLDRGSALLSGLGFLAAFLTLNNLRLGW